MRHGRRGLFILLVVGILLPGAVLAVFGFRSLQQEQILAGQRTRESLRSAADLSAREVNRELARWREWSDPTSAILVLDNGRNLQEAHGVLWRPGGLREPALTAEAEQAEEAEIRQKDYAKALNLYENALRNSPPGVRAAILMRIARTSRKAGDLDRALRSWRQVLSLQDSSAITPARFALAEAGAAAPLDLYRDLISGRFPLARESYFFYAGRARELIGERAAAEFQESERSRLALTEAVEDFLANPRRIPAPGFVAFWQANKAVLLAEAALHTRLTKVAQAGIDAAIRLRPRQSPPSGMSETRALDDPQLPWQLEAAPRDPAALERSLQNRQAVYFGSLAAVFAALVSGVFLTARAVRREAEFSRLHSDFVATVSHEFRSPLTGIRQLTELLESGIVKTDERRQEYYHLILQESDRLTHLVENLLDFSRLEAGRKEYRMEAIDSSFWLEETATGARSLRLSTDIPAGLPAVRGDRHALSSVVGNLMDNALKYSPPNRPVQLVARTVSGKLSIAVTDQGPGITREEQSLIFERFYRGGGELSRQVKGAGIGLSLVKRIVEDHGGNVSVVSNPGEGSTFTIELPINREHAE